MVDKFKVIHVNFFYVLWIMYANNYSNRLIFDKSYSKCKLNVYVFRGDTMRMHSTISSSEIWSAF